MIFFRPDVVLPHDPAGFGLWRINHYNEHRQFIQIGTTLTPTLIIPDFDIAAWSDEARFVRFWLDAHKQIHDTIDQRFGITTIDLSAVDLSKDDEWNIWMSDHALAHSEERQALGVT